MAKQADEYMLNGKYLQRNMRMKDELLKLLKEHAYRKGEFKLSSGKKSEHYVNCKPVTLSAQGNKFSKHFVIRMYKF